MLHIFDGLDILELMELMKSIEFVRNLWFMELFGIYGIFLILRNLFSFSNDLMIFVGYGWDMNHTEYIEKLVNDFTECVQYCTLIRNRKGEQKQQLSANHCCWLVGLYSLC